MVCPQIHWSGVSKMRPTKFDLVLAIVLCLGDQSMRAATTSGRATSDPQALLLVAQSAAVLTGGVVLQDVLLTGNVIHIAGSDYDIGAAKLEVSGNGRSRLDVAMGDKRRIEIRSDYLVRGCV